MLLLCWSPNQFHENLPLTIPKLKSNHCQSVPMNFSIPNQIIKASSQTMDLEMIALWKFNKAIANGHVSWVNPLFLWPLSIANC